MEKGQSLASIEASEQRRLDELVEEQQSVHHVADAKTGRVITTILDRPITPLARAARLSSLGLSFDPSIFGGPSYRLTPRKPYIETPLAWLSASNPSSYSADTDRIHWNPPRTFTQNFVPRGFIASFDESPDGPSVLSIALSGKSFQGSAGHLLFSVFSGPDPIRVPVPNIFAALTIDISFVPLGGRLSRISMQIEQGVETLVLGSVSFHREWPVVADLG
jgi:hypothetical protein